MSTSTARRAAFAPPEHADRDLRSYLRRRAEDAGTGTGATLTIRARVESASVYGRGWTRARLRPEDGGRGDTFTAVGHVPLEHGHVYEVAGTYADDPKWGEQLQLSSATPVRPADAEGVRIYLTSLPGLGPVRAARVVEAWGADALARLEGPGGAAELAVVCGLRDDMAAAVVEAHVEQRDRAATVAALHAMGCGAAVAAKLFAKYGRGAVDYLRANPYKVAETVDGIGFVTADTIARRSGTFDNAPERCDAAVRHVLLEASTQGHTALDAPSILRACAKLDVPAEDTRAALDRHRARYEADPDDASVHVTLDGAGYAPRHLARAETAVAQWITADAPAAPTAQSLPLEASRRSLTDEQAAAVRMALGSRVSVLTGPPGTGKTYTTQAILADLRAAGLRVLCAAPTGKAAVRMEESTGVPAVTVHRLLGYDGTTYARSAADPIDCDALIVDESSMLDASLAAALVAALRPERTRLVLVGDAYQLPSVGPGSVLRDLIQSGAVPVTRLTQIHRQAAGSAIVRNAHRILRGEDLEAPTGDEPDFILRRYADDHPATAIAAEVVEAVARHVRDLGFALRDIQVLCASHRGDCGTRALNLALQARLNPPRAGSSSGKFRRGDRVIQTRNNYELDVFNGEVGVVEHVDAANAVVDFGAGRMVEIPRDAWTWLELAYAISIHKSQGSEFPAVVIPAPRQHAFMLGRQLLYTGITRAKRFCAVVAHAKTVAGAIRNTREAERRTQLREMLLQSSRRTK